LRVTPGAEAVARIVKTIAVYDDFCHANDPYEEYDFGSFARRTKATRDEFLLRPRRPTTVVLDGVTQNYNIGAIFRLCDAFLVQVVCSAKVELHKRKSCKQVVADAKARGAWVVVAEQTTAGVRPERVVPVFPAVLVLAGERSGVSSEAIEAANAAVAIPMLGLANSLNLATPAAILLYCLSLRFDNA
jgi:tRNA G18 (ribose-2'-O)-methylase SpoU